MIFFLIPLMLSGQRGNLELVKTFDSQSVRDAFTKDSDTIMLWPGATGDIDNEWALYRHGYEEGFAFGTNIHNDQAFGQHFSVEEPYKIVGGRFWFPGKEGEEGHIVITVWDMADGTPGEPLYEEGFYFADVPQRMNLPFAWVVEFSESVRVDEDYLIGVNVSNLKEYEHATGTPDGELIYGLGNVSSHMGDGGEDWLAWVKQEDGDWVNTKEFGDDGWDLDIGIFPYVIYEDDGGTEGYHEITFNLDMEDAVAVGDVAFDPDIHDVYIAGSFADWVRPGDDEAFRMQVKQDSVINDKEVIFAEDFKEPSADGSLPEGWLVKQADNADGYDLEEPGDDDPQWILYSEINNIYDPIAFNPDFILTGDAVLHCTWDIEEVENTYAISPPIDLPHAESIELEYWSYFVSNEAEGWFTKYSVIIEHDEEWVLLEEFDSEEDGPNMYADPIKIDLSEYEGTVRIAWVHQYNSGVNLSIDDISVTASGMEKEATEPDLYTLTVEIEEGAHEYKYFLVEDNPTWDLEEYEADHFRSLTVDGPAVVSDTWGDDPTVDIPDVAADVETSIFPNPASGTLNISASENIQEIRFYNVSGSLVQQVTVGDLEYQTDITGFPNGVYILHVQTASGVSAHKLNVYR